MKNGKCKFDNVRVHVITKLNGAQQKTTIKCGNVVI